MSRGKYTAGISSWVIGIALVGAASGPLQAATEIAPQPWGRAAALPVVPYQALLSEPAPAPTSAGVKPTLTQWEVKASDVTLARTLERWALAAGYKLKWDASRNFLIGASDVYTGTFESALQSVLSSSGIRLSDYPLEACIYANTPPLVRITRQGEQARECSAATE